MLPVTFFRNAPAVAPTFHPLTVFVRNVVRALREQFNFITLDVPETLRYLAKSSIFTIRISPARVSIPLVSRREFAKKWPELSCGICRLPIPHQASRLCKRPQQVQHAD